MMKPSNYDYYYLVLFLSLVVNVVPTLCSTSSDSTKLKMVKPTLPVGFEGDLVAVHNQIVQHYGISVATRLTALGILEADASIDDDGNEEQKDGTSSNMKNKFSYNRWPKRDDIDGSMAVVSYQIDESFVGVKSIVERALQEIENVTNILKFVERNEPPYVRFTSHHPVIHEKSLQTYLDDIPYDFDCWSYVGYQGFDEQHLNIGSACLNKGYIQHEVLHTLGLWHESSRFDRDEYIQIMWENIWNGLEYDFHTRIVDDTMETPYDYASIMHDDHQDFANFTKGGDSIVAPEDTPTIGQLKSLSEGDIWKLRLLYQCKSGPRTISEVNNNGLCTEDCKCWISEFGCGDNDDACQGDLICTSNRCIDASSTQQDQAEYSSPDAAFRMSWWIRTVVSLGCLVYLFYYFFGRKRDDDYQQLR